MILWRWKNNVRACLLDWRGYNSLGSGGSGKEAKGPTSIQSEYANLYALRTYSSTSNPFPEPREKYIKENAKNRFL